MHVRGRVRAGFRGREADGGAAAHRHRRGQEGRRSEHGAPHSGGEQELLGAHIRHKEEHGESRHADRDLPENKHHDYGVRFPGLRELREATAALQREDLLTIHFY